MWKGVHRILGIDEGNTVLIAATTNCFRNLTLEQGLGRITDLEFSYVEIMFHESNAYLKPSVVVENVQDAMRQLRSLQRLVPAAFSVEIDTEDMDEYVRQFVAICRIAKVMQVVTIALRSAPWGFPFNSEVERLRKVVAEATPRGIVVGLVTEPNRLTEDLETAKTLCKVVPGLNLTLDPSHCLQHGAGNKKGYESVLEHVCHIRLRDLQPEKSQVCVGQGAMDFGRIVNSLMHCRYNRALSIDILPDDNLDVPQELRKMRLLLESLL